MFLKLCNNSLLLIIERFQHILSSNNTILAPINILRQKCQNPASERFRGADPLEVVALTTSIMPVYINVECANNFKCHLFYCKGRFEILLFPYWYLEWNTRSRQFITPIQSGLREIGRHPSDLDYESMTAPADALRTFLIPWQGNHFSWFSSTFSPLPDVAGLV